MKALASGRRAVRKGWRLWLIFVPVLVGACWMLLLDVLQSLVTDVRRASFYVLTGMIDWAGDPYKSDG